METVCEDMYQSDSNYDFSDNAAHAICRDMGWSHAIGWDGIHVDNLNLEDYDSIEVECTSAYWMSCRHRETSGGCAFLYYYVFLTCGLTERLIQGM